jgi:HlyD family secretion protein
MLKAWRLVAFLFLCFMAVGTLSCDALGGKSSGTTQQLVQVRRGDLTVTVSGSGNLEAINSRKLTFGSPGQVGKVHVVEGQPVAKGDRIATLVTDALELAVAQAEVALAQAVTGVNQADIGLKTAERALNEALGRHTFSEVETAQTDLDEARAYVQYIISNMTGAPPAQQPTWATALIYAQARLAAAEAKLNALISNYDTEEMAIRRLQVDAARQSRDLAQQSSQLARRVLDQTRKQLDEATIVAPFDGIVARLNIKEKDPVSPAVVIGEIIDPSKMRLEIQVDEIDITEVRPGQQARIEVDALPTQRIEGTVDFISLAPTPQSGVVTYDTRVVFEVPAKAGLRVGMSASADISVAERKNVLLAPDRAIRKNSSGDDVVTVMLNGQTAERVVTTGISDGIQTEITGGLAEGDTVVVERSSQSAPGLF